MISRLCYELYKLDYKRSHSITLGREMESVKTYYSNLFDEDGVDDSEYTYDDYLNEFGYNGELYVCYDEFLDTEYLDEDYMCSLLNNNALIAMYKKDIARMMKMLNSTEHTIKRGELVYYRSADDYFYDVKIYDRGVCYELVIDGRTRSFHETLHEAIRFS